MSKSIKNRHNKYGTFIKICGGGSNKKDKSIANKKFRRLSKLNKYNPEDCKLVYDLDEVSNVYNFSSDGLSIYIQFSKGSRWRNEPYSEYDKIRYRRK